jgi:hypothetical protein
VNSKNRAPEKEFDLNCVFKELSPIWQRQIKALQRRMEHTKKYNLNNNKISKVISKELGKGSITNRYIIYTKNLMS